MKQILEELMQSLPATGGYEKGYRDALESVVLALSQVVEPTVMQTAITTALDAYANNVMNGEEGVANRATHTSAKDPATVAVTLQIKTKGSTTKPEVGSILEWVACCLNCNVNHREVVVVTTDAMGRQKRLGPEVRAALG